MQGTPLMRPLPLLMILKNLFTLPQLGVVVYGEYPYNYGLPYKTALESTLLFWGDFFMDPTPQFIDYNYRFHSAQSHILAILGHSQTRILFALLLYCQNNLLTDSEFFLQCKNNFGPE